MYSDELTEDVDDFLAHYGVKGMKWGVRNSVFGKGASQAAKKKYSTADIRAARGRQAQRARSVQRAEAAAPRRKDNPQLLQLTKQTRDAVKAWENSEDRYVANRKTRGEKIAMTLIAGPVGAYLVSNIRTGVRAGEESIERSIRRG